MEEKRINEEELEQVAGGFTLATGQTVTKELIDQYAVIFKDLMKMPGMTIDAIISSAFNIGFHAVEPGLIEKAERADGRGVDQWATLQKDILDGKECGYAHKF